MWSKLAFSVPTVKACFDHGGRLSVSRVPDRADSPDARTAPDWPGLLGAHGARPRGPAPPRFSVRRGHVDKIAFRAHFLRFVACVHPFPPLSGHPRQHPIITCWHIETLTWAFPARPCRRAPFALRQGALHCNEPQKMCANSALVDAFATNLKKCTPRRSTRPQLACARRPRARPARSQPHETCTNRRRLARGHNLNAHRRRSAAPTHTPQRFVEVS